MTEHQRARQLPTGLLPALCHTYADLLRRQRTAASPFARWTQATRRAHEFVWLGGAFDIESLMQAATPLKFPTGHLLFDAVHKMYGTARLNPYEREILYGYPYVIGRVRGKTIRGPLLTLPVEIEAIGNELRVHPADETLRFNSLPFRTDTDSDAHDQALARVMEATPPMPLSSEAVRTFAAVVTREIPSVQLVAHLDGTLTDPPSEPTSGDFLQLIDQAALFVAPKTSYFLRSDLEEIAAQDAGDSPSALGPLLVGAGDEAQVDFTDDRIDSAQIYFPFPSNRAQRRVALLVEDPNTNVIRVEGPPGTGKSLTIANLACHLAATGKRVLVTSQKDKALQVVDEKLRELNLAEIPMTLLRHDRESKRDLLSRLERAADKRRPRDEVEKHYARVQSHFGTQASTQLDEASSYAQAIRWEDEFERAHRDLQTARHLRRISRAVRFRSVSRKARKNAPKATDELAERVGARRGELQKLALGTLQLGAELAVAGAKRAERQVVRELQDLLKRDQRAHRNFSLFDRLKKQTEQSQKLLRILPVWVLSPDDVARLFPCQAGLFDVVIVDEASQVDLPSLVPVAYRGTKLVIFGDTKQMQSQRFAFMSRNVAVEAWKRFGMDEHDPDHRLHPMQQSLLNLAAVRADEEVLLDEHFRSLPPIIEFSNRRWYDERLRIMTDVRRKRFGPPGQPVIEMHLVEDGVISNDSQENEAEARALVAYLGRLVTDPDYADASIGVLCLFEEQVSLVHELVTDLIDPEEWAAHDLVVVNPDGFQGDERDVILYSLSWDNKIMPRAALSARQADSPHIQGMLNVAFTRARDEIHVFHSAPVDTFGMAGGHGGALGGWMTHCAAVHEGTELVEGPPPQIDSEFEGDVAGALRKFGVSVRHQYPACGFRLDLVCEFRGGRVAVECDGELYHHDEHGNLRIEDIERQGVLERAGWRVLRIPYRKWVADPQAQVQRVLEALRPAGDDGNDDEPHELLATEPTSRPEVRVTADQVALIEAIRSGCRTEVDVLRAARASLGHKRLGPRIREALLGAARDLNEIGILVVEDGEYFLTAAGRGAQLAEMRVTHASRPRRTPGRRRGYRSPYRRRY